MKTISGILAFFLTMGCMGCNAFKIESRYVAQGDYLLKIDQPGKASKKYIAAFDKNNDLKGIEKKISKAYQLLENQLETLQDGYDSNNENDVALLAAKLEEIVEIEKEIQYYKERGAIFSFEIKDHTRAFTEATDLNNENIYKNALAYYEQGGRSNYQLAAEQFEQIPGYKDANTRYQESKKLGTKNILFMVQAPASLREDINEYSADIVREIENTIKKNIDTKYLDFIYPAGAAENADAMGINLNNGISSEIIHSIAERANAHEVVFIDINNVQMLNPTIVSSSEEHSKSKEIDSKKGADGKVQKQFKTIKAYTTLYTRTYTTSISATAQLINLEHAGAPESLNLDTTGYINESWHIWKSGDRDALEDYVKNNMVKPAEEPDARRRLNNAIAALARNSSSHLKDRIFP